MGGPGGTAPPVSCYLLSTFHGLLHPTPAAASTTSPTPALNTDYIHVTKRTTQGIHTKRNKALDRKTLTVRWTEAEAPPPPPARHGRTG
ncbi:hypothetical protein E2C01_014799 [Portunus trituberculatus]|uniref:Uncharacterized protein n=1 Tax=Portunus trituberculatus TaxID=210409 RepID=A0A5B7DK15_PORTR|nr:hypothetical protein [Portunus trituberculatus]